MKNSYYLATLLLLSTAIAFGSCVNRKTTDARDHSTFEEESTHPTTTEERKNSFSEEQIGEEGKHSRAYIIRRVEEIYTSVKDHYSPLDETQPIGKEKSADLNQLFCSDDWNRCLKEIETIDSKPEIEMGFFDADYWVMGQDYSELDFKDIKVVTLSDQHATVCFLLHNFRWNKVKLDLTFERGDWYIDNFYDLGQEDSEVSWILDWKTNMKDYIREQQEKN